MAIHTSSTLLSLLLKGGWLMVPLALLSIVNIYILTERLLTYYKHLNFSESFLEEIEKQLVEGNIKGVQQLCIAQDNLIQHVMSKALNHPRIASQHMELMLENESSRAISLLEEKLSLLATIAGAAPMIGFLGTVTGMIQTFMSIAHQSNSIALQTFSNGIYEAMVTTIVGLVIGIIAYLGYNYCTIQVNKTAQKLSYLVNLLLVRISTI